MPYCQNPKGEAVNRTNRTPCIKMYTSDNCKTRVEYFHIARDQIYCRILGYLLHHIPTDQALKTVVYQVVSAKDGKVFIARSTSKGPTHAHRLSEMPTLPLSRLTLSLIKAPFPHFSFGRRAALRYIRPPGRRQSLLGFRGLPSRMSPWTSVARELPI